jgi:hypothetical protein
MTQKDSAGDGKARNPFAKSTYRVVNEPFKILGILDSRYATAAAIPAVFCGLFAAATNPGRIFVGAIAFLVFAWQAYRIAEGDPQAPLVYWLTLTDKSHASGFTNHQSVKGGDHAKHLERIRQSY